jgi:hypothetical protein
VARLWLALELAHNPATSRLWEHGIYAVPPGAADPPTGLAGLLGVCPEGNAWVHGAADEAGQLLAPSLAREDRTPWPAEAPAAAGARQAAERRRPAEQQTATLLLGYDLSLAASTPRAAAHAALARGVSADGALTHWQAALAALPATLAARATEDERFWARAPQLSGDWPAHWRRGLATDLETLRMVVRPTVGVFARPWDGMQIQAPRSVLAETALDALSLAWADPALARGILLECFASAPRPNVPCQREDGSYNMVADDGAICGTGPEWGWPLVAAEALWRRSGDREWLAALYPRAAAYLEWWLAARTDGDGWLVHACSWESGQDVSARFGEQQTGGSAVRHLRPVDLQAAAAQGCALLATWSAALDRPSGEVARWQAHAARLAAHVQRMWRGAWFYDFDAQAGRWSEIRDPMHLAPLLGRLATPVQIAALRPSFAALPSHGVWPALVWPPVAYTALEAALPAGLEARAAELAAEIAERAWQRMDARDLEPDGGLPGVARESWPLGGREVGAGIEGYGWGALTTHFVVRYIVGLREASPTSFHLMPSLPAAWRRPGAVFSIDPLPYGAGVLALTYRVPAVATGMKSDAVDMGLTLTGLGGPFEVRDEADGGRPALARGHPDAHGVVRLAWRGAWLREIVVRDVRATGSAGIDREAASG